MYNKVLKELRDPALRSIGARRLIGFGTATAVIPPTVVEVYRGLYGIGREQLGAMKRFLPEWSKESTIVPSRDAEGNYYYTDFSHGFAYDTVINPVQSVITNVGDLQDDEPLIKGMVEGTTRALSRLVEPFISESIYFEAVNDIISRGGVTDTGQRLYNEEEPEGDKYFKALLHVGEALLPGSVPQFTRIGQAALFGEDPKTGRDLDLSGEIGGFFGFRNIKMDIPQSMDFKITEYNTNLRNSRGLLPRPAGNVKSKDIIDGFIAGNRARFKAQQEMAQDIKAMQDLGFDENEIREIFRLRNLSRDYNNLTEGRFKPFGVPGGLVDAYIRNADENNYENPYDDNTIQTIQDILYELRELDLDEEFPDFTPELPGPSMAAMPQTPQPVVPPIPQQVIPQTGLTQTETALLSPEEQIIRQRTRT